VGKKTVQEIGAGLIGLSMLASLGGCATTSGQVIQSQERLIKALCRIPRGMPRGMNACLAEEVIRESGASPLSS
jgi:hypothetical protein